MTNKTIVVATFLFSVCGCGSPQGTPPPESLTPASAPSAKPAMEADPLFPAIIEAQAATFYVSGGRLSNESSAALETDPDGVEWGYIDSLGKIRIRGSFEMAREFREGLAAVRTHGKFGYVNRAGELVIPAVYDEARPFSEKRAAVGEGITGALLATYRWGFVDESGHLVVPMRYGDVWDFSEGMAKVMEGSVGGFVDRAGQWAFKPQFHVIYPFSSGLARVGDFYDTNPRFIRPDGSVAFAIDTSRYGRVDEFREGLVPFYRDGKFGYLNCKFEEAIPPRFDDAEPMHEGVAAVRTGDLWGFVDSAGKIRIKPAFVMNDGILTEHAVPRFSSGYAFVTTRDGWKGFIDTRGEHAFAAVKDTYYCDFQNGLAEFRRILPPNDYEWGYVNPKGETVYSKKFSVKLVEPKVIGLPEPKKDDSKELDRGKTGVDSSGQKPRSLPSGTAPSSH